MQQATDFIEETRVLHDLVERLPADALSHATRFKRWSVEDILRHLHFWNGMVDIALADPSRFADALPAAAKALRAGALTAHERAAEPLSGASLVAAWIERAEEMAPRWAALDPKRRIPWAGPDMSVRSAMTARHMEVWAHGQAVFDLSGEVRQDTDRVRNIVVLGLNTFAWTYRVRGLEVPPEVPALHLEAPSGAEWIWNADARDRISGRAVEFAQVVAQTRNIADTALVVEGPVARDWMARAQCFAGPAQDPPPPGSRGIAHG